jgi:hypothetical protein
MRKSEDPPGIYRSLRIRCMHLLNYFDDLTTLVGISDPLDFVDLFWWLIN